jgi:hypothetical protein
MPLWLVATRSWLGGDTAQAGFLPAGTLGRSTRAGSRRVSTIDEKSFTRSTVSTDF